MHVSRVASLSWPVSTLGCSLLVRALKLKSATKLGTSAYLILGWSTFRDNESSATFWSSLQSHNDLKSIFRQHCSISCWCWASLVQYCWGVNARSILSCLFLHNGMFDQDDSKSLLRLKMPAYVSWAIPQPSADGNLASSQLAVLWLGIYVTSVTPEKLFSFVRSIDCVLSKYKATSWFAPLSCICIVERKEYSSRDKSNLFQNHSSKEHKIAPVQGKRHRVAAIRKKKLSHRLGFRMITEFLHILDDERSKKNLVNSRTAFLSGPVN